MIAAFVIAGVIGVLAASLLEYFLVAPGSFGFVEVGFIEPRHAGPVWTRAMDGRPVARSKPNRLTLGCPCPRRQGQTAPRRGGLAKSRGLDRCQVTRP